MLVPTRGEECGECGTLTLDEGWGVSMIGTWTCGGLGHVPKSGHLSIGPKPCYNIWGTHDVLTNVCDWREVAHVPLESNWDVFFFLQPKAPCSLLGP